MTTSYTLRPLSLGELLDQAIRLYRRNFLKFIGIIALIQIPVTLLNMVVTLLTFDDFYGVVLNPPAPDPSNPFATFTPGYFIGLGSTYLVGFISFLLVQGIASGALTRLVADTYLGQPGGALDAYRRIGKRWLPLVGTLILYILLFIALFIWLIIPCFGWLSGPGLMVVFGGMMLPMIAPAVVLENASGPGAIRRAWELVRRRFWWVIGFMLILYLFAWLVISGPVALISLGTNYLFPSMGLNDSTTLMISTVLNSLVGLVFGLLYKPLQLACTTLLYFDLRVRQEGLDLALQTGDLGKSLSLSEMIAQSPTAPQSSILTWKEFGYIIGMGVAMFILYFGLVAVIVFFGLAAGGLLGGF